MASASPVQPLSAACFLREATAQAHADVEALPHMPDLASGTLPSARYVQILLCHLDILGPWERAHAPWLEALGLQGWPYCLRAPALDHDLSALGASREPISAGAPQAAGDAYAWGMLYVVEGSLLGGRVIARQLRMHQPRLAGALAYFDLGSQDPAAWRRFQGCLDARLDSDASREQAAAGARAMFAHFHHHLSVGLSA